MIDKDLLSSLLARQIGATTLIMLTDIECVYLNFLGAQREAVHRMTVRDATRYVERGEFLAGSMAPKIAAAIAFLRHGGTHVVISLPEELPHLLSATAGTRIIP